jgi:putative transposase
MANLFVDVLFHYRDQRKYGLHEFVLMPDHFHLLLTPNESVEKAVQFIKGGFSYRAKKEINFYGEIWGPGFHDRRVRDWEEYSEFRRYIHMNPMRAHLCDAPELYPYSSAGNGFVLDDCQQLRSEASKVLPITSGAKALDLKPVTRR